MKRRWDLFLTGLLGARCRLGCGARVWPKDLVGHEEVEHAGDALMEGGVG